MPDAERAPITDAERDLLSAASRFIGAGAPSDDFLAREIVVTPYDGAYGRAGYVVVVNGSPPRGLFIYPGEYGGVAQFIVCVAASRSRRIERGYGRRWATPTAMTFRAVEAIVKERYPEHLPKRSHTE